MRTPKSSIRCVTEECAASLAKYGEHYHAVYDLDPTDENGRYPNTGAIAFCERCGGYTVDGKAWIHRCKKCGVDVAPRALTGLFVPHLCSACEQAAANAEIARGAVCRRCHQPNNRCCC